MENLESKISLDTLEDTLAYKTKLERKIKTIKTKIKTAETLLEEIKNNPILASSKLEKLTAETDIAIVKSDIVNLKTDLFFAENQLKHINKKNEYLSENQPQ